MNETDGIKPISASSLWADLAGPLLILAGFVPLLIVHFVNLSHRPQYQHFPFVLAVVGWLLWTRTTAIPEDASGPRWRKTSTLLFSVALAFLLGATALFSPWIAAVGFVVAAAGAILIARERYRLQNALGTWLVLCLVVPLPGLYDVRLSQLLQRLTTLVSGGVLEWLKVPNIVEGTTLSLATRRLFIEEACSGIVSMMAIVASCLIVAVVFNRAVVHTILLVVSGIVWAALTNVFRIVTLGVAQEKLGIDLSDGWRHDALGLVLFAVAVGLAVSTDQFLGFLLDPIEKDDKLPRSSRLWNRFVGAWDPLRPSKLSERSSGQKKSFVAFGAVFVVVGLSGLALGVGRLNSGESISFSPKTDPLIAELDESFLPERIGDWERVSFDVSHAERLFAQESRIWRYQQGNVIATFSLDFSFPRWHDLCECYRSVGWSQNGKSVVRRSNTRGGDYLVSEFFKSDSQEANLCFSLVQDNGTAYPAPEAMSTLAEVKRRMEADKTLYQIQLWATEDGRLSPVERSSTEDLFQELRALVVAQISKVSREYVLENQENRE